MNDKVMFGILTDDLREATAQSVVYLEGKTDVQVFFGLLGVERSSGDLHQGVLIRGLKEAEGSGSSAVAARARLGATLGAGVRVVGIVDGDGAALAQLAPRFDPPFAGPLFSWKAYSIENLLQKAGWPPDWGKVPDWAAELQKYAPYVALNRLHRKFAGILKDLNISRFTNPDAGKDLLEESAVSRELGSRKGDITGQDVQRDFREEADKFRKAVSRDLNEARCLLNGKWLISHLAVVKTGKSADDCRAEWIAHVTAIGGLNEVKDWWLRVFGKQP